MLHLLQFIKRMIVFALLGFLGFACGSVSNPGAAVGQLQTTVGVSAAQVADIDSVLSLYPNGTRVSIALIDDSTVTYYGAMRQNDTLKTVSLRDAVFEVGSISKVFTSAILAELVTRDRLQLDEPIAYHLDFELNNGAGITFRQLASHTSGLPRLPSGFFMQSMLNMNNPYKNYDEEKLRSYMREDMELEQPPDSAYNYSNVGAGILGYVLTQIADKPYEQLLQEMVFKPYGMERSTADRSMVKEWVISGLNQQGNPTPNWDFDALAGAGAILSTAEDLSKFARANFNPANQVLRMQREKVFTVNDLIDLALGWHILKRKSGEQWHWHNGGTGGYRSSFGIHVPSKRGVVVLSNISSGHNKSDAIDRLCFKLMESLKGQLQAIPLNEN